MKIYSHFSRSIGILHYLCSGEISLMMNNEALILTNSYWDILKSLSDEVKLCLATRLTASIVNGKDAEVAHTEEMLNRFCGVWKDGRSAEDIIRDIKGQH